MIGSALKPVALHPGHHYVVALIHMRDLSPLGYHHPRGLVPKHQRAG